VSAASMSVPPGSHSSLTRRALGWLANPWDQSRFTALMTWLYILWAIVPLILAILFSFNAGRSRSTWQGFSLRWYTGDPDLSVLHDPTLRGAVLQTLKLALGSMAIATPIGVALALGLARWRGRGSGAGNLLMLFPLVTPEIVMGSSLLIVFTSLYTTVPVGTWRQLLGHVTFSISYVVIVVRGRLLSIGKEYEEAAMDLGASPIQSMVRVLLPLLYPAIFASLMIVFALSVDDLVISQFLSGGEETITVPIRIYSNARSGPTPALNALATVMLVATTLAAILTFVVWKRAKSRGRGGADIRTIGV
jgi:spermidine/putrescine transport system permease protein